MPSKPLNLSVIEVTSTTMKLSWMEPQKTNGAITSYVIYYDSSNQTFLHLLNLTTDSTIATTGPVIHYVLSNLSKLRFDSIMRSFLN